MSELAAGTGSAPGIFQSNGNYDVIFKTGNSTSGVITIIEWDMMKYWPFTKW